MRKIILLILFPVLIASCTEHFITDNNYRAEVRHDLDVKLDFINHKVNVDSIISLCETPWEREAMTFLYAYMPIGDMVDYDPSLYLDGIRCAYNAKKEFDWGKKIPEHVFRHFVLPLRVNNEGLDSARQVFYGELRDRVKGLSMYDAVLEVNHWCHEKVTYVPTDNRTSSPLETMKNAKGRCGEESVFTVTALRSVGIPARQVYTPRWAHTDNNHAWVEAWVDGKWYYLGACEPEPELNVAWFSSTALRSLLMHSKVFGKYVGDEEVIGRNNVYTELNVTPNYAPVGRIEVTVKDKDGNRVEGAKVEFKIYNYSEFYTAITAESDKEGRSGATFGLGDVMVWASKDGAYGYEKVSVCQDGNKVEIILSHRGADISFTQLDIIPPAPGVSDITLTKEQVEENAARFEKENEIREAYYNKVRMNPFVLRTLLGTNDAIKHFLLFEKSGANSASLFKFIAQNRSYLGKTIEILGLVNEKDLRDINDAVILDCIINTDYDGENKEFVLNPRILNERLVPYRTFFKFQQHQNKFVSMKGKEIHTAIGLAKGIKVADEYNPQRIPITPIGVFKLGVADRKSRDVFFVALCRYMNIPARIDAVGGLPQYFDGKNWVDVNLDVKEIGGSESITPAGKLDMKYKAVGYLDNPKYETHFTLSQIMEDGSLRLVGFVDKEGQEGLNSWKSIFNGKPIPLNEGNYLLVSGTRMASGKVLATMNSFTIEQGKTTVANLVMREDPSDLQVIGNMDAEAKVNIVKDGKVTENSILGFTGRGYFVLLFAKSNHEPSNHAIHNIINDKPSVPALILFRDQADYDAYAGRFPSLPEGVMAGVDVSGIRSAVCKEMKLKESTEYPLYVVADTFGRIVYIAYGYDVTTAERISRMKLI